MDYVQLGRTALRVSRLCVGSLNFGVRASRSESFEIMDAALGSGINFFDTANDYGWQEHRGFTEELIGEWFVQGGGRREKVVIGTKVCNPMTDWPNDRGLSARHIIASCDDSLRRLRTDWIDLYQMHEVDPRAPWDEVWQAMEVLTHQGKIRYVGSSNFGGWHIAAAQEAAARRNFLGIVSQQCIYNLISRDAEREIIPAAAAYGVGVVAWSPLHGGLLSGALRKLDEGTAVKSAQGRAMRALPAVRDALGEFEKFCGDEGLDPAGTALSWVLSRPGISAVVIGPRTMAHLDGAGHALETRLSEDLAGTVDKLFVQWSPSAP